MDKPMLKSVHMRTPHDDVCDPRWLGKFTDHPPPGSLSRGYAFRRPNTGHREYRYFLAGSTIDEVRKELSRRGCSRQTAEEVARDAARQDWKRMEALARGEWYFMGIQAEAKVVCRTTIQTIRSAGLWGVESDAGREHLLEIAMDELTELTEQLECFQVNTARFAELAAQAVAKIMGCLGHPEAAVNPSWTAEVD